MNASKLLLTSFSVAAVSCCPLAEAQQIAPSVKPKSSTALGGPIMPTQPDFFPTSSRPAALNLSVQQKEISAQTLVLPVKGEPAPLVDDLPRSQEGFLRFKLQ